MMFFPKAALALTALTTFVNGQRRACKVEFFLYDADTDESLRTLKNVECIKRNQFNIQARPTAACGDNIMSAQLYLDGPIEVQGRMERKQPYMVFGDDAKGDIFGLDYEAGNYNISADLYSGKKLGGEIVVSDEFEFRIKRCT